MARLTAWVALALVLGACAPAATVPAGAGAVEPGRAAPKRVTAAIMGDLPAVGLGSSAYSGPGYNELAELVLVGLSTSDPQGRQRPKLAEAVPTTENGLWTVFPDGRMETRWKIRSGARWQDGAPFTADDLVFSTTVIKDPEVALSGGAGDALRFVQSAEAPDPSTLIVRWRSPFLQADQLFKSRDWPMPKHLLERAYREEKAGFMSLPYWTEEFVGNGPFQIRDWVRGSYVILGAYDDYVLGRPTIDEIEVKFIPDVNALVASVLAGAVTLSMGRGISLEDALQVRNQWREGTITTGPANPVVLFPKLGSPEPAVVSDPRFRRAMLHAIDRQGMMDTLLSGLSTVAYGGLRMSDLDREDLGPSIVRYEYDVARAAQLLAEIGYRKGSDGVLRDAAGRALSLELNTDPSNGIQVKGTFVIADYWQRLGMSVEPSVVPAQQLQDRAWTVNFKAFSLRRNPVAIDRVENYFGSSQIPTAANNYRGSNYSAYSNPETDALIQRFNSTVPRPQRIQLGREVVHLLSDQLIVMGLFYDIEISLIGNRLKNVWGRSVDGGESWNAEEWDLT